MSQHTLTPGERVVHDATGERGTLISTNGISAVVEWDSTGGKNPADILPVADLEQPDSATAGLEAFTDDEILAELQRRKDDARKAEYAAAAEHVRRNPETLHRNTRISELHRQANAAGLCVLALTEIWFATYGKEAAK